MSNNNSSKVQGFKGELVLLAIGSLNFKPSNQMKGEVLYEQ
jgi:hypothetical protein